MKGPLPDGKRPLPVSPSPTALEPSSRPGCLVVNEGARLIGM